MFLRTVPSLLRQSQTTWLAAARMKSDDKYRKLNDPNWPKPEDGKGEKVKAVLKKPFQPGPSHPTPAGPCDVTPVIPIIPSPCKPAPPPPPTVCPPCPDHCLDPWPEVGKNHPVLTPVAEIPLDPCICEPCPEPPYKFPCPERPIPYSPPVQCPTRAAIAAHGINPFEAEQLNNEDVFLSPKEMRRKKYFGKLKLKEKANMNVSTVSGVPEAYRKGRYAFVYRNYKNCMQSGTDGTFHWRVRFDTKERWENPNIGWTSSGDAHSCLILEFPSQTAALDYCLKNGYDAKVMPTSREKSMGKKNYAENFTWNKRTRRSTK